jgi:hypothetical protein
LKHYILQQRTSLEHPWPPLDHRNTMSLVASFIEREVSSFFKASSYSAHSAFSSRSFLSNPMILLSMASLCLISLSRFYLILGFPLLTFEYTYECLHLLIKLEISKNRRIHHDLPFRRGLVHPPPPPPMTMTLA